MSSYRITIIKKDGGAISTTAVDCTLKQAQDVVVQIADRNWEHRIGKNAPIYIGEMRPGKGYKFYRLGTLRNNIERDNMTSAQKDELDAYAPTIAGRPIL